jgi:Rrf2 family protein
MLSHTAQYALRTVVLIASRAPGHAVPVDQIAAELRVPRNYLSKTLHQLARAGVLSSTRGPGGGFRLAVPPARLRLAQVIEPFDTLGEGPQCLLGRAACSDRHPCAAHGRWKRASNGVAAFFRETTVADLLRGRAHAAAAR